jgi:hypothetical protein
MPAYEDKGLIAALTGMMAQHQEGQVFVTESVSWQMRNVTKRARKNYLGIYEEPYDPITGEEKYFPPLTESFTDGVIKSVDIDLKDIDIFATNSGSVAAAKILKLLVRQKLKEARFGEALNELIRYLCIDGSGVLKFGECVDSEGDRVMKISAVDTLNLIADQSACSLEDCFGVLERSLYTQDELRKKKNVWKGIEEVIAKTQQGSFIRNPFFGSSDVTSPAPMYPIYDYWGQMEKCWITGKEEDSGIWIEGHAIVANLHDSGNAVVMLAEENTKGYRPYEDVPLKKVLGRRQGRGIPEMLFGTQKYMNMLVEIRKKNAQIMQNGLFKAKKSLGLTADSILSKLTTGGIVQVTEMDDFEQMPIQDARASSYGDEDRLMAWGERNTGMFDVRRGESMAASAPATTQLIQDRNSKDLFQLVMENLGLMLERFVERHVIPWVIENVDDGQTVMITGNLKDLEDMDDAVAEYLVNQDIAAHIEKNGQYPKPEEVVAAKDKQLMALRRLGNRRYVQIKKSMLRGAETGVQVIVTNESVDRATILQKLQELLTLTAANPGALGVDPQGVIDTIFDMMNVPTDRIYSVRGQYQTPINKLKSQLEIKQQAQQKADQMQADQNGSQVMNAVTGKVAPQQNSQNAETPKSTQAMAAELKRSVTNQSVLSR